MTPKPSAHRDNNNLRMYCSMLQWCLSEYKVYLNDMVQHICAFCKAGYGYTLAHKEGSYLNNTELHWCPKLAIKQNFDYLSATLVTSTLPHIWAFGITQKFLNTWHWFLFLATATHFLCYLKTWPAVTIMTASNTEVDSTVQCLCKANS